MMSQGVSSILCGLDKSLFKESGMLQRLHKCVQVLLLYGVASLLLGCGQNAGTKAHGHEQAVPGEGLNPVAPSGQIGSHGEPAAADEKEIRIDNFSFAPAELTVAAGAKVTWVNHDDVPHTATSSVKPRQFDSGTLDTDERFSHVFTTPGTYPYFCAVHPRMVGQIIVK
jgi:plastocyanin